MLSQLQEREMPMPYGMAPSHNSITHFSSIQPTQTTNAFSHSPQNITIEIDIVYIYIYKPSYKTINKVT